MTRIWQLENPHKYYVQQEAEQKIRDDAWKLKWAKPTIPLLPGALPSFHLFPLLPIKIGKMIWESTFVPRRVILEDINPRDASLEITNLRLVNWEANEFFHASYQPCFPNFYQPAFDRHQEATLFNFKIDTLGLAHGIQSLADRTREIMARIQRIQIAADLLRNIYIIKVNTMEPSCLTCDCTITIRPTPGEHESWRSDRSGTQIMWNLEYLKTHLARNITPRSPYRGPRLRALFTSGVGPCRTGDCSSHLPGQHDFVYSQYNDWCFETTTDLFAVRWGTFEGMAGDSRERPEP